MTDPIIPPLDLTTATGEEISQFTIEIVWRAGHALGLVDYRGLLAGILRLRKEVSDPEVRRDMDHKIRLFEAAADFKDVLEGVYLDMQPTSVN